MIVETEKHRPFDSLDLQTAFAATELKDITGFQSDFLFRMASTGGNFKQFKILVGTS